MLTPVRLLLTYESQGSFFCGQAAEPWGGGGWKRQQGCLGLALARHSEEEGAKHCWKPEEQSMICCQMKGWIE